MCDRLPPSPLSSPPALYKKCNVSSPSLLSLFFFFPLSLLWLYDSLLTFPLSCQRGVNEHIDSCLLRLVFQFSQKGEQNSWIFFFSLRIFLNVWVESQCVYLAWRIEIQIDSSQLCCPSSKPTQTHTLRTHTQGSLLITLSPLLPISSATSSSIHTSLAYSTLCHVWNGLWLIPALGEERRDESVSAGEMRAALWRGGEEES